MRTRSRAVARWSSVLMLALVGALSIGTPTSRAAGLRIGIGEQKASMFASPYWARLHVREARYIAPWDVLADPYQLTLLDTWMQAARTHHVRVLLGFAHSLRSERMAHVLPRPAQLVGQFRALRKRYPWVDAWLVWNEANNPGALTANRPRLAAAYYNAITAACPRCRIVGADILDVRGAANWIERFQRAAHRPPRIWGLHNYGDANGFKTRGTQTLLALTRGEIWFTETGGLVIRRTYFPNGHVRRVYRYSLRHAAQATIHTLQLACLSPRITRIYLYHWQAPPRVTNWDSGLLTAAGRPRPAYRSLQSTLRRDATATATGLARAKLCARATSVAMTARGLTRRR